MLKNKCLLFVIGLSITSSLVGEAQTIIGMGTDSPNPNAVLELVPKNSNQGFLAPRLTSAQRTASAFTGKLTSADNGLLVFDTNQGQFFYWYQGEWRQGVSGEGSGGNSPGQGTTWYTGTAAPAGINAQEGDFYINENTGDIYRLSNSTFRLIGSLGASEGGSVNNQNLEAVLQQGNSAANQKITNVGTPTDASDAATKDYVDDQVENSLTVSTATQDLKSVLDDGNNADGNKITNLADPDANQDAATKKYVDDQVAGVSSSGGTDQNLSNVLSEGNDANTQRIINLANPTSGQDAATKSYVDGKNRISAVTFADNKLVITEDGDEKEVDLSDLEDGGTPSTLPEGNIYLGDNNNQPQTVKIQGDITIAANGTVTITNGVITSAKLQDGAVTANKIANSAITTDKVANNAVTSGKINNDAVTRDKIASNVAGVGLSQANDGSLQVNIGDGLTIDEGVIKVTNTGGGGGNGSDRAGTWYTGPNEPASANLGNAQPGDYYYSTNQEKVYRRVGGNWQEVGGFTSTDDVQLNGQGYSYRAPWLYTGSGVPNTGAGKVGDFYYDTNEGKLYFKKSNNEWDDF